MDRRTFCIGASGVVAGAAGLTRAVAADAKARRVAVIGHTGRGNYGHGLDTVWQKIDGAQIVAVADANADGLAKEQAKLKVDGGYTDYRKMLAEVKPEFVSVCPRHADQHHAMALASIEAGVRGVYVEKPLCRTPGEADALVAACDRRGARLAVAHRNRYHPALQVIDRLIADGGIGKLLEIRGRGKGDRRGGAEDLWVLGSHVLNLTAYFGGDPRTCSAVMRAKGRPVTKADVIDGAEGLGPLAGDELHARYEMSSGVIAYFDSIANDGTHNAGFGLQLVGSEGVVNIQCDLDPVAHLWRGNPFQPSTEPRAWTPITSAGVGAAENQPELIAAVQHHEAAVRDLIDAVDHDRAPICDIGAGRTTVEMVCAVFESHRQGGAAVAFPLTERDNALRKL